jgi:hypothetical protein
MRASGSFTTSECPDKTSTAATSVCIRNAGTVRAHYVADVRTLVIGSRDEICGKPLDTRES